MAKKQKFYQKKTNSSSEPRSEKQAKEPEADMLSDEMNRRCALCGKYGRHTHNTAYVSVDALMGIL